jgi:ATP-dependent RNA helicase DeaD
MKLQRILMTTEFSSLDLRPELLQAVSALGYTEATPIQAGIIPHMLNGADVFGQAQTGTGKTAAFALPILQNIQTGGRLPQALVLAPTRELALQVAEAFSALGKFCQVRVLAVYGGSPYVPQIKALKQGVDVVVGTPGRLIDLLERKSLDLSAVRTLVLDEADEMLSMGFIDEIEKLIAATPGERQTTLFSATLPSAIRRLAERYLRDPQTVAIEREQVTVAAIEQRYYLVNEADKTAALTRLFEVEQIGSALIFVRTRAGTGELAVELTRRGFPSEAINGDLAQEARERTLNRFRKGQIKVLVATDVAARGLDIENISHVFNYDLPDEAAEIYVHRIGRTGRAGRTGIAISLVTPREKRRLREIEAFTHQKLTRLEIPSEEQILAHRQDELLEQVQTWLARGRCKQERALVETLVAAGTDPLDIAAAALKLARGGEKQRPIAKMSEVTERPAYRERGSAPRRFHEDGPRRSGGSRERSRSSHEQGMVRLSMSLGRRHGIRPSDVVGAIAFHADIPGSTIGRISIEDGHTLVDVPEALVGQVLSRERYSFRRQPFTLERAD